MPGCRAGGGGSGRSATILYHCVGISCFRRILVHSPQPFFIIFYTFGVYRFGFKYNNSKFCAVIRDGWLLVVLQVTDKKKWENGRQSSALAYFYFLIMQREKCLKAFDLAPLSGNFFLNMGLSITECHRHLVPESANKFL